MAEVRQRGMILAIELVQDKARAHAVSLAGTPRACSVPPCARARGVLLRPLGNVIYFMPPYVITPDEIRYMAEVAWEGIELATSRNP